MKYVESIFILDATARTFPKTLIRTSKLLTQRILIPQSHWCIIFSSCPSVLYILSWNPSVFYLSNTNIFPIFLCYVSTTTFYLSSLQNNRRPIAVISICSPWAVYKKNLFLQEMFGILISQIGYCHY